MSNVQRKPKKRKQAKAEPVKKREPEVVNCKLADNDYTGIIREGALGSQYLDCANAKYTWNSGIKYEGPFIASQIEGKGKFEWQDGSTYTGELHCGKRHGQGLYIAKDGVTKYEGQWYMGNRHGEGKLIYNADASSFYEGSWKDGKKNGEGKQVWPSGNTYCGQWEDGQMRGHGTMTWNMSGQIETYTGNWEDSQPHGEGTHTWLAPEPKPEQAFKDTTSQQLNNRYKGQWHKGQRQGKGTFYYANGAYYSGEWADHVKHGRGRHVFEDGRIYDGPFENDAMVNYDPPKTAGLNFGNEDNPVRRMIDISDINMFACPFDRRGLEGMQSPLMYLDSTKVLRETYNILLRSLGDLRELYYRYRVLLPIPGEDPFVLSAHQFWLFARDCGVVTPTCMLHRLDRQLFGGPRRHIEIAPEDAEDTRQLTPRASDGRRMSAMPGTDDLADDADDADEADDGEEVSQGSMSSRASGAGSPAGREIESRGSQRSNHRKSDVAQADNPADITALPVEALGSEFLDDSLCKTNSEHHGPRPHKFRRDDVVFNIHEPKSQLLFRQFVEGVVRLALVRFPCEKSMDIQVQRLFRENNLKHLESLRSGEKQPFSDKAFDFLADPDFRKTLTEFSPTLLKLFRGGAVTTDVNDPNYIVNHHRHAETGHIVRIRHYGDFGAPIHQYHVCARLDKTIRVKDALRLFSACGFLKGLKRGEVPWADLSKQIFHWAAEDDLLVIDEQEREAIIEAQQSGSTTPSEDDLGSRTLNLPSGNMQGGMGGFGGFGGFGGQSGGVGGLAPIDQGDDKRRKGEKLGDSRSRRRPKKDGDEDEKTAKDKEKDEDADATSKVAALSDLAHCDFQITPIQALRVILEVASPGSLKALHWHLDPTRTPISHETISLLEFAENELIFTEFVRLLIRISDLGTRKDIHLCERLSAAVRFEGFVRHIFLPALRTPYVPPTSADETEKASDAARSNENGDVPHAAEKDAPPEAKSGEDSNAGEEDVMDATKDEADVDCDLWLGFDDYSSAEVEAHHAPRRWPGGYEHEITNWM